MEFGHWRESLGRGSSQPASGQDGVLRWLFLVRYCRHMKTGNFAKDLCLVTADRKKKKKKTKSKRTEVKERTQTADYVIKV